MSQTVYKSKQLIAAAELVDWEMILFNGGPPCFHVMDDGKFCLRAERWFGHYGTFCDHKYVSLAEMLIVYKAVVVSKERTRS